MKKSLSRDVNYANVSAFVDPKLRDIRHKVTTYPGVYGPLECFPERVHVKVFDHAAVAGNFVHRGIEHVYVKRKFRSLLIPPVRLFLTIRAFSPDVIHLHGLYFPHVILMLRFVVRRSTKLIVQDHANALPNGYRRRLIRMADRRVDHYLFTSQAQAKPWIDAGVISDASKIVECAEGSTFFQRDERIEKDPNAFLWVARLDANKDPITILKGFSALVASNPKARLTLFFSMDTLIVEVQEFIEVNELTNSVQLKGKAPQSELEHWYQRSSYFLMGSSIEGGSFALIEAMACGCIPIVTDIPANRAMLNDGTLGHLFGPKDVSKLKEILTTLDYNEIPEKSKAVVDYFKKELSLEAIARKIGVLLK